MDVINFCTRRSLSWRNILGEAQHSSPENLPFFLVHYVLQTILAFPEKVSVRFIPYSIIKPTEFTN